MSASPQVAASPTRILVVEDEQVIAMNLERTLAGLGYEVAGTADTGRKAVRLAGETHPDLVLMDVMLRGPMDGIAAAEEIRHRWQIPVVYTTAYTSEDTIGRAKVTGSYGFLVKPYRAKELNATIEMALHQHRLGQEVLRNRAWLNTILSSIADGVIATDMEGRIQFFNPVAEQLTGWTRDQALGKDFGEVFRLLDEERQPVAECSLFRALRTSRPQPKARFTLLRRDGTEVPIEDSATPIESIEGQRSGAVAVFRDISDHLRFERLQAEERERLEDRVRATERALGETRTELRALAGSVMTAKEEEGRRLARELHDDFTQRLALLEMEAQRLRKEASPGEMGEGLERIGHRAAELSYDLRTLSHRLHPSILEDLGLVPALRALVEEWRTQRVKTSLVVRGVGVRIPLTAATSLYRIAQEALRNVAKHAPDSVLKLHLSQERGEIRLKMEDSGPGFDLTEAKRRGGLGLLSMQERARLAGGSLIVQSRPGAGTTLLVRIPLGGDA